VTTMGVKYPASIAGATSGAINPAGAEGAKDMTAKAKQVMSSCPQSKIVLSGYSQGAEQVHGALQKANLGTDGAKIAAAVTYGDPMAGERTKMLGGWGCLPEDRTSVFCNKGDGVCTGQFSISAAHLSYTSNGDIAKGAAFAVAAINKMPGTAAAADGGSCKWALNAADYKGAGGAAGGAPGGGAPGKGGAKGGGAKGGAPPKGKGSGGSGMAPPPKESGGEATAPAPEAAAPAPEAAAPATEAAAPAAPAEAAPAAPAAGGEAMAGMEGM